MATTPLQGWTVPGGGDAPANASAFATLGGSAEKQSIMRFATQAARDAAIPAASRVAGMAAFLDSTGVVSVCSLSGVSGVWVPQTYPATRFRNQNGTASGTLGAGAEATLTGTYTIPASPFGAGVNYLIDMYGVAACNAPANSGMETRLYVDGSMQANSALFNTGGSLTTLTVSARRGIPITNPDTTHVVETRVFSPATSAGLLTFFVNANNCFMNITLDRYLAL